MLTRNQLGFINNESSQKKVISHEKEVSSSWTQVRHLTLSRGEAGDDGGCRQLGELPAGGTISSGCWIITPPSVLSVGTGAWWAERG